VISWFENQVIDKNFYRGIRDTTDDAVIFGCQPFVFSPSLLNIRLAEAEIGMKVTPDVVLVSGPAYVKNSAVPHRLGPSFRYAWLWSSPIDWARKSGVVVLLPYDDRLAHDVIAVAAGADALRHAAIAVKPHPASSAGASPALPREWHYSDRTTADLLAAASVVITSESGTAVEGAVLGCSVVVIASQSTWTANPMPEDGQGEIWELAFDSEELDSALARLAAHRELHPDRIKTLADAYRAAFFVEPTRQQIANAFQL